MEEMGKAVEKDTYKSWFLNLKALIEACTNFFFFASIKGSIDPYSDFPEIGSYHMLKHGLLYLFLPPSWSSLSQPAFKIQKQMSPEPLNVKSKGCTKQFYK